eukprot:COSAG02_NODE_13666_length_1365_cov_1.283570_3_plen_21_part_01
MYLSQPLEPLFDSIETTSQQQ